MTPSPARTWRNKRQALRKHLLVRDDCDRLSWMSCTLNAREVPEFHHLNFGSACLTRAMAAQGSLRWRLSRAGRLSTVYWFAHLSVPSSDQLMGVDTGAPGRARVE